MRPSIIPDEEVWENATRKVIAAPDGDLLGESGYEPVEALVEIHEGTPMFHVRMVLDEIDVARIKNGERVFWYTQHGNALRPFSLGMPRKVFKVCRHCHQDIQTTDESIWFHRLLSEGCPGAEPVIHP